MSFHLLPFTGFGLAILFLILRLYTGEKRDFIISVAFIVLASAIATFDLRFSSMYYFLIAIILSFLGDLLMAEWVKVTDQRTLDGVMAFGFAHIIYIFAFNELNLGGFEFVDDWYLIVFGLILWAVLFKLVGSNDKLPGVVKVSNAIYGLIIASLVVMVLSFVFTTTTPLLVKIIAALGIFLFVLSDSILAYNEFQKPIPRAKEIIAVTYILAQIFLQITPLLTLLVE